MEARTAIAERVLRQQAGRGKPGRPIILEPIHGTRIRALYDLFMANPEVPIPVSTIYPMIDNGDGMPPGPGSRWWDVRRQLTKYDLDIRKHSKDHWWLVVTEAAV